MLKHQNPNIEIINKNLWAVRFSLISMIPQLTMTIGENTDVAKEPFALAPEGIIILNKDMKTYPLVKSGFCGVMKLNPRQIDKELNLFKMGALKKNGTKSTIYHACLTLERERRKMKNGGES